MKLFINALSKIIFGFALVFALLFLPAGSFNYGGAWLFIALLFIPMIILGVFLFIKSPKLLKSRLSTKEKEDTQKAVVAFSAIIFLAGFILAGFDFRFGWTFVSPIIKMIASVIFVAAYGLYAEVMRENAYLSRTIEVVEDQKIIDTGLYGMVRHPMYMATVLLFLAIPLILGSLISFAVFLLYPFVIAVRIKNEEKVLTEQLEGYAEYKKKVKYRLIPFIW